MGALYIHKRQFSNPSKWITTVLQKVVCLSKITRRFYQVSAQADMHVRFGKTGFLEETPKF